MKQFNALAWKEWQQHRLFLFAGLAVFFGISWLELVVGLLLGTPGGGISVMPAMVVLFCGGLLAIIVAVCSTCQELRGGLESFWRSRPISVGRWLLVKYFAGLITVQFVCCLTLVMHLFWTKMFDRNPYSSTSFAVGLLTCHSFTLVLIYSVSFLLGCLVRHTANAGILSIGALLLIYFLPVVLGPLEWLGVSDIMMEMHRQQLVEYGLRYTLFVVGMLLGSGAAVLLSVLVVKHNWRLRSDQRLMCWSIAVVVLILFGAAAFQVGSNMSCEQNIVLPATSPRGYKCVHSIEADGNKAVVLFSEGPEQGSLRDRRYLLVKLDLSDGAEVVGEPVTVGTGGRIWQVIWCSELGQRAFLLVEASGLPRGKVSVWTVSLDSQGQDAGARKLDLSSYFRDAHTYDTVRAVLKDGKIYVSKGKKLAVVSIENPDDARVLEARSIDQAFIVGDGKGRLSVRMIAPPGLDVSERLGVSLLLSGQCGPLAAVAGNIMVTVGGDGLGLAVRTYRLLEIDDDGETATFELTGQREPSAPERFLGKLFRPTNLLVKGGFAYCVQGFGMTVYDLRDTEKPRRVGHYAAGEQFWPITGLSDGRVLVGGADLHILAPPDRVITARP
ncbi:MAG: ABC transporter permease [Planctomycetota bacterium]|jgi:ABC-type transport system involved in multi-copper enzyme maturation permease subunit